MRLLIVVVLVGLGGAAAAQPRAVSVASTRRHHQHPPAGLGASLAFGWAGQHDGPAGWSGRLEYEVFPVYAPGKVGALFGFLPGFEIWRSGEDNWGFSLPVGVVAGARVFPMRAVVGAGLDAIVIDQVDDDTGFGMYAPFALARLGVDVLGFQIGADARVGYRWQIGAPDHARWQLGLFIAKTVVPPNNPLRRAHAAAVSDAPRSR